MTTIYRCRLEIKSDAQLVDGGFEFSIASDLGPSDFELMLKKKMKELK